MGDNAIYFPYIRVPENEWFTRSLLFWDNIGSIVPVDFMNDPQRLGSYMNSLVKENLVKPIIPMDHIYKIPNFTDAFLEYVDRDDYPLPRDKNERLKRPTSTIHMEKLEGIGEGLRDRGLASRKDWRWFNVETYTANQFMAYLSGCLGFLPELKGQPITDTITNLNSFSPIRGIDTHMTEIDQLRTVILEDMLPCPKTGIHPHEIAKFKTKYNKDLKLFRTKIESSLIDIDNIRDPILRARKVEAYKSELHIEVDYLTDLMKSSDWKNITTGRLIAYSTLGLGLGAAILSGGLLGVVIAALGIGGAGYDLYKESIRPKVIDGHYCAYAVMAQRQFQ